MGQEESRQQHMELYVYWRSFQIAQFSEPNDTYIYARLLKKRYSITEKYTTTIETIFFKSDFTMRVINAKYM